MTFEKWWASVGNGLTLIKASLKDAAWLAWKDAQPQWQPPSTAPKDGTVFLGDVGYPWPVVIVWNGASEKFVFADLQVGMYHGEYNDTYFENEYEPEINLKRWMPIPDLPEVQE